MQGDWATVHAWSIDNWYCKIQNISIYIRTGFMLNFWDTPINTGLIFTFCLIKTVNAEWLFSFKRFFSVSRIWGGTPNIIAQLKWYLKKEKKTLLPNDVVFSLCYEHTKISLIWLHRIYHGVCNDVNALWCVEIFILFYF